MKDKSESLRNPLLLFVSAIPAGFERSGDSKVGKRGKKKKASNFVCRKIIKKTFFAFIQISLFSLRTCVCLIFITARLNMPNQIRYETTIAHIHRFGTKEGKKK